MIKRQLSWKWHSFCHEKEWAVWVALHPCWLIYSLMLASVFRKAICLFFCPWQRHSNGKLTWQHVNLPTVISCQNPFSQLIDQCMSNIQNEFKNLCCKSWVKKWLHCAEFNAHGHGLGVHTASHSALQVRLWICLMSRSGFESVLCSNMKSSCVGLGLLPFLALLQPEWI